MLPVAILAGGLATRLRPLTEAIPKALVEINGEPFLAHQLRLLSRSGFERVVLCAAYRGEQSEGDPVIYCGNIAACGEADRPTHHGRDRLDDAEQNACAQGFA